MSDFEKRFAIGKIKSEIQNGKVEKPLKDFITDKCGIVDEFCLIAYKYHEVLIGTIREGQITIEKPEELTSSHVIEMRIFNADKELYIWKDGAGYKYRLRTDSESEQGTEIYDVFHMLWGEKIEDKHILTEERGMRIKLPFNEPGAPVFYKARNYFKYNDKGQIEFYDARLVSFVDNKGEVLNA